MMNKTNEVAMEIRAMGVSATVNVMEKNGIEKYGISLGDGNVKPTMYLRDDDNRDARTIAEEIIQQYNNLNPEVVNRYNNIGNEVSDFNKIKDKIIPCLMKSKVESLVTKAFLDMNIYYRIVLSSGNETTSIKITKSLFKMWNISKSELYDVAISNTNGTFGARDVFSVLMGIDQDLAMENFMSLKDSQMFVVTNNNNMYGAAAMLHNKLFKAIANDLNSDLYIIPSSIHEVIVVPESSDMSPEYITSMIQDTNATEVLPEEVLSDHVYIFRRADGIISCD